MVYACSVGVSQMAGDAMKPYTAKTVLLAVLGWAMLTVLATLLCWQFIVGPILMQLHQAVN